MTHIGIVFLDPAQERALVREHQEIMRSALREAFEWGYPTSPAPNKAKTATEVNTALCEAQKKAAKVAEHAGLAQQMSVPAGFVDGLSIRALQQEAHNNACNKGWWDSPDGSFKQLRPIPELLMLVTTEVAEAMEAYRDAIALYELDKGKKPVGFAHELADVMIRVADMAEAYGIDLEKAIKQKMAYNATRPHRHGGKRA